MALSEHKITEFENKITELADQPNMQPDELKQYFDSSPEELRQAHNGLCDALAATTAAAEIGFAQTAGVPEGTVQDAIENVQAQVTAAIIGSIPSGSIDNDKLAQDVRNHFTAIEASVTTEAGARSSGDSNLQTQINAHGTRLNTVETQKCEIYAGIYTGNDASSRTINLGFKPKAVLVLYEGRVIWNYDVYGGLVFEGHPTKSGEYVALEVASNGFIVHTNGNGCSTNDNNREYHYIAFK